MSEYIYRVFDKSRGDCGEYWISPHNKSCWSEPGAAKNAWNVQRDYKSLPFNKDANMVIHKCDFVLIEELN